MKALLALLITVQICLAQDAYFFEIEDEKRTVSIQDNTLTDTRPIKRVKPPKALSIAAFYNGLGPGREYQIQIDLAERAKEDWTPSLKLGSDILIWGLIVSHAKKAPDALHIESDDKKKIVKWVGMLSKLLQVPEDEVTIDLAKPVEQPGNNKS